MRELLPGRSSEGASKNDSSTWRLMKLPMRRDHVAPTRANVVEKNDGAVNIGDDSIDVLEVSRISRATFVGFHLRLGKHKCRDGRAFHDFRRRWLAPTRSCGNLELSARSHVNSGSV
jgi:hypothetical protein